MFHQRLIHWIVSKCTALPIPKVKFMSRYFFDLRNGGGPIRDETGMELESRNDVAKVIRRILLDVVADELTEQESGTVSVIARDQSGRSICVSSLNFNSQWLE